MKIAIAGAPNVALDAADVSDQTGPMHRFLSIAGAIAWTVFTTDAAEPSHRINVSAGDLDRTNSLVSFPFTANAGSNLALRDADGHDLPVQSDSTTAWFIEPRLPKGASKTYALITGATRSQTAEPVSARPSDEAIRFEIRGRPVFSYQVKKELPRPDILPEYKRNGYVHPLFSPSGLLITDHYARNHLHQHGIWSAWTKTDFQGRHPDFWNMGQRKGLVEMVSVNKTWSGTVHAGLVAQHRHVDLTAETPAVALNETWTLRLHGVADSARPMWVFDLQQVQTCATSSPLKLPKYHYGGLGFRGNWDWNGADNTHFLTSEGETNRVRGNETTARWCHISGLVDGKLTGLAILCHPKNFRAPQPMRLHPAEPFFCYAPSQGGDWEIKPGEPYVARYRFVVFDGAPDRAMIDALWQDYAEPVQVAVRTE